MTVKTGGDVRTVLMTTDAVGGVWSFSIELARGLAAQGKKIVLATLGPRPDDRQRQQATAIEGLILEESDCPLEWMPDHPVKKQETDLWLLDLDSRHRPDIIHVNGFYPAALPWRAPVLVVGHSCVLSWWQAVHGTAPPDNWAGYKEDVTRGLKAADLVVAPTDAFLQSLERTYSVLRRSRVIWNGRTPGSWKAGEKAERVLGVGRVWDASKNLMLLDRIAPRLSWPVVLAGNLDGPEGTHVQPLHAETLGHVMENEVGSQLAAASIFVSPALYEPFGLAVLEAAMAGCALVLSDIPTLRELWDGVATFVPPHDDDGFVREIERLAHDGEAREALALAAAERARLYTAEAMVERYAQAYRDLHAERHAHNGRGRATIPIVNPKFAI